MVSYTVFRCFCFIQNNNYAQKYFPIEYERENKIVREYSKQKTPLEKYQVEFIMNLSKNHLKW